jgi:hypothetical protein
MSVYLKPTTERNKKQDEQKKAREVISLEREKARIAKALDEAEETGRREISILVPTAAAIVWLENAGYQLRRDNAAGCGDMDSITISW